MTFFVTKNMHLTPGLPHNDLKDILNAQENIKEWHRLCSLYKYPP